MSPVPEMGQVELGQALTSLRKQILKYPGILINYSRILQASY